MEQVEIRAFIEQVELFQDLDGGELDRLAAIIEVKHMPAGTYLFRQQQPRKDIFIIYAGDVQLLQELDFAEEKALVTFGAGDFLGENVIIDDTAYSTSARTLGRPRSCSSMVIFTPRRRNNTPIYC